MRKGNNVTVLNHFETILDSCIHVRFTQGSEQMILKCNFNLLQLVLSACVAAVKYRHVLHHCVVIFFWSSGIMDTMLFK